MCPLIPETFISFCSLVTSCPDNLTRNKTISSSKCPYKNLINVGGDMTSVLSDSEFISYHNCLGCLPMLDIRKAGLPRGLGCDQSYRICFIDSPNCSIVSSSMSRCSPFPKADNSLYISSTKVSSVFLFFFIFRLLKCFDDI